MKKISTLLTGSLFVCASLFAQERALQFQGDVKNSDAEWAYLHRFDNKIFSVIDSARISEGKFAFETELTLPELYGFSVDQDANPYYLFLDVGRNEIVFDAEDINKGTVVQGSPAHAVFQEYRQNRVEDIAVFIEKYPDNIVSSYVLYREWSYRLSPEELERNIELLSPVQQQSRFMNDLRDIIQVARTVSVGQKAPQIIAADTSGNSLALYDNLKKYTLVDFWASWCGPCRRENPNIVANYQKYKDKGFAIYAISLDKSKEAWLKGINDDGLDWLHVSELSFWDSEVAAKYAVRAIPANFLLDENGVIVAKDLKGEQLGEVLDSLFNPSNIQ